jgi:branched-chain amino acid transport system ATP-binding protein
MLEVESLTVSYGGVMAVDDVSIRVGRGEIVGLVGANGAGKTSTLTAVVGGVRCSGAISLNGTPLVGLRPEAISRAGVAVVPEGRRIFGSLTVAENLLVGASSRRDRRAIRTDAEHIYERFGQLGELRNRAAGKLSGGEQQLLAIARGLMARPTLLLLDEPSLGLAPRIVDEIFDLLGELRREGITILLVEQNITRTVELADRTYILKDGRIARAINTAQELFSDAEFRRIYLGAESS